MESPSGHDVIFQDQNAVSSRILDDGEKNRTRTNSAQENRAETREIPSTILRSVEAHFSGTLLEASKKDTSQKMEIKRESCQQKAARGTKNFWVRCKGLGQKSNVVAKIKLKESQLVRCKQSFGVKYMDMVEQGASNDELQRFVIVSQSDMDAIKGDIMVLRERADYIERKTKSRIVLSPTSKRWDKVSSIHITPFNSSPQVGPEHEEFAVSKPMKEGANEVEPEYVTIDAPYEPSAPPAAWDRK